MSQTLACPFCGAMMEAPLRFCQECGRAVTPEDLARAGLKFNRPGAASESGPGVSSSRQFALSKKDHSGTRQMRGTMLSISMVLLILITYYSLMKFVIHQHMPGNLDIKLEMLARGQQVDWSDWKSSPSAAQVPPADSLNQTSTR
jgi:hypothetical protein